MDNGFEKRKAEYMEKIRGFRLIDDTFMSKVFEDKKCAEFLLHILLERNDLTVRDVRCQYEIKNLQGRSVRLDILATDEEGKYYNVEVQRNDKGAVTKRARYNSSLIDANITDPGDEYEKLNETYVIFITENDVLGENLPVYHIERTIRETGKSWNDGTHILYVNAQIRNETALGKLMHDFYCSDVRDMNYPVLSERARYFKEDEKGAANMCKIMEELCEKSKNETRIKIAISLWKDGIHDLDRIARLTELTVEDVKKAIASIPE